MAECIGIVGVGLMGQAFLHHLLQAGFKVQGFDLDERRLAQLHERGGTPVESPAAAARGAQLGVPMHVGKLWAELQQEAVRQGLAELDSSAFIEVLRTRAGMQKRA